VLPLARLHGCLAMARYDVLRAAKPGRVHPITAASSVCQALLWQHWHVCAIKASASVSSASDAAQGLVVQRMLSCHVWCAGTDCMPEARLGRQLVPI
jgi:hypothetical protein